MEELQSIELLNNIYNYLFNTNSKEPLMELLLEFCQRNDYDCSEIGEIISSDEKLKKAIEMDCIKNHYFKGEIQTFDTW